MNVHAYIQSGIIESYLLGIAGEEEKQELNRLRCIYPEIERAIHSAEEWLYGVSGPASTPVPAAVKEKIFASIQKEYGPVPASPANRSRRRRFKYLAVASWLLLVCSMVINLLLYAKYHTAKENALALQEKQQELMVQNQAIQEKMNSIGHDLNTVLRPGSVKIVMDALPGKGNIQSTLLVDVAGEHLLLVSNSLPNAPSGKQYQLWAIVEGKPVNAGLLGSCEPWCKFNPIANAQAYAVTLEQSGGSLQPTLEQMYVFGKVQNGKEKFHNKLNKFM